MPHERRFIQSRLVDFRTEPPTLLPEPRSRFLYDPRARGADPVHTIEAASVSELGVRLESRHVLARGSDGRAHLWLQRRRFPHPRNTSRSLSFDVLGPELPAADDSRLGGVALAIDGATAHPLPGGLTGATVAVEVRHDGDAPLGPLLLLVEHGDSPRWCPAVQSPRALERLLPGETLDLTLEATIPDAPVTSALRVTLRDLASPGTPPAWATHPFVPYPPEETAGLALEPTDPVRLDGPVASVAVQVTATPADLPPEAVVLELRGGAEQDWLPLFSWRTGDPVPRGDGWVAAGRATWNVATTPGPVQLRARAHATAGTGARIGRARLVAPPEGGATSSARLGISFGIRDLRPSASGLRALGVALLHNAGTEALNDAVLTFEQRQPAESAWRPIRHDQESPRAAVAAGQRVALPVLLHVQPASPIIVRARAQSPRWALADELVTVR